MNIEQFSKEHLSAVLDAFIRVKGGEIDDTEFGICWNATTISTDVRENYCSYIIVEILSSGWPKYSGLPLTPVSSNYRSITNKWEGEEGALRYELLDFLIDELTKVVNKDEQKIACTIELFEGGFTNDQQ